MTSKVDAKWGVECLNTIGSFCLPCFIRDTVWSWKKNINITIKISYVKLKIELNHHAYSRVDRGNLVLRHSIPHLLPNLGGIEWWNSTPLFASTPERRNGNINLNKYLISSSGDRSHNRRIKVTVLWASTA